MNYTSEFNLRVIERLIELIPFEHQIYPFERQPKFYNFVNGNGDLSTEIKTYLELINNITISHMLKLHMVRMHERERYLFITNVIGSPRTIVNFGTWFGLINVGEAQQLMYMLFDNYDFTNTDDIKKTYTQFWLLYLLEIDITIDILKRYNLGPDAIIHPELFTEIAKRVLSGYHEIVGNNANIEFVVEYLKSKFNLSYGFLGNHFYVKQSALINSIADHLAEIESFDFSSMF